MTDNGGEYVNEEVKSIFASKGIKHADSPPYSHESNGVAERYNRTIMSMVRCWLKGMSLRFWSEAVSTAVYIKNRLPHKAVKEPTPYEGLHKSKPMVQYLQPFGRKCYVHVPVEKRPPGTKLLPRAVEGIFVGYTDSTKIYRIYVPSRHKIEVTRQVRFAPLDTAENDRKNIKPIPSQVTTSNDQSFEIEAVDTTPMIISQIRKGKDKQPQPESEPEDNESEKSQTPEPESEPEKSEKPQTPQPESEPESEPKDNESEDSESEDNESEGSQTLQPEPTPKLEPVCVIPPDATVTQSGRISHSVAKYATALINDDSETYMEVLH